MIRVAIDTNRLTDLFRGDNQLAEQLSRCDEIYIPIIVIAELRAGFYAGSAAVKNNRLLQMFLNKPTVSILLPDLETTEHYGWLYAQLRKAGTPIPTNDLWIGALALQHRLTLITRDGHFQLIPQLLTT
ncbi:MAG: type II toxin-antitoxin system VapC family toxin [Acidobacteriota bacterium]